MLKELFEATFYVTFPARKNVTIALDEQVFDSDFSLVDPMACRDCRYPCASNETERHQLLVKNNTSEVHVISFDDVFKPVGEQVGLTCDYMLDDGEEVALVEMTCATSEYVTSKRQKARAQLYNTLCLLRANPVIKQHLEQEESCFVVFSWKETLPQTSIADSVESGMMGMASMVDSVYSPDNFSIFDYGFLLREIRYPLPFVW